MELKLWKCGFCLMVQKFDPLECRCVFKQEVGRWCTHCGHFSDMNKVRARQVLTAAQEESFYKPNAQGEHSPGAAAEGDMLDPVVVPDFAPGTGPEKKVI